ncbi:MarR family winged helix-turn-helix transcriptional regulator [Egicoccus sp. AB-alg2]|uniref:MarR family winged helix-turn-helix transcriptional regulator n=1 Tax=Egicoccus sp. AB-alg2 TaxID=3242693 RepID=UPI00359DD39E
MDQVQWLDEHEATAWRGLQFMQMRLEAALARQLSAESSLSLQDFMVLVALTDHPDGRLRAFELANTLGWDKTRLSHHLKRMSARDLVEKQTCPTDRRGYFVAVTVDGREAIRNAAPGHVATVRRLFLDLVSDDELETIIRVTSRVLDRLSEDADGQR